MNESLDLNFQQKETTFTCIFIDSSIHLISNLKSKSKTKNEYSEDEAQNSNAKAMPEFRAGRLTRDGARRSDTGGDVRRTWQQRGGAVADHGDVDESSANRQVVLPHRRQ